MAVATRVTALAFAGAVAAFGCRSEGADTEPSVPAPVPDKSEAEPPTAAESRVDVVPESARGPRVQLSLLGRYKDPAFGAAGLPALSADGKRVAYTEEQLDGGRGNPNLTLVIRSVAADRPVKKLEALAADPRWQPEDEPVVRGRLEAINKLLAADSWEPMRVSTFEDDLGREPIFVVGDLEVRIQDGVLRAGRGRVQALTRPLSGLLGRNREPSCRFAPQLAEVYTIESVLLVRIGFAGQEGCFRESEYHVVRLR